MMYIQPLFYKKGYKYQTSYLFQIQTEIAPDHDIITDLITLTTAGLLVIQPYYAWDGPSGPMIDTKGTMTPSLVHDALYQLMRMGFLAQKWRVLVDTLFKTMIIVKAKIKWWGRVRANYAFRGLQLAHGKAAKPRNKKKEYIA